MSARFTISRLPLRSLPSSFSSLPRAAFIRSQARFATTKSTGLPYVDNDINGGYVNPPQEKRQFRDPHGDWWDKQDRRNFGEPVHEDNDILTIFSTEQYTHFKPPKAFFLFGCAVAVFATSCGVLAALAPEAPFVPRTWDDDLEEELGGPLTMTVGDIDVRGGD